MTLALTRLLAAVDDDILWLNPAFQHALLGVVTTPTEQSWGFDPEVTNLLLVSIHYTEAILLL